MRNRVVSQSVVCLKCQDNRADLQGGKMEPNKPRKTLRLYAQSVTLAIIVFLTLLSFCTANLSAKPVDKGQAEKAVRGWLKADARPLGAALGRQIKKIDTFADDSGEAMYYVVYLQPSGFVVVPCDDLVEPVICFADSGTYDPSDDNPLGALVSRDIPARIAAARAVKAAKDDWTQTQTLTKKKTALQKNVIKAHDKWNRLLDYSDMPAVMGISGISEVWVEPLVQSMWGQTTVGSYEGGLSCYNYYTPPYEYGNSYNYPCGCVATAMAQLMRYREYPGTYVWNNMPLQPDNSISVPERQAIGQFCFDAAESVDTIYASGSSEASLSDASRELRETFYYTNSIRGSNPTIGDGLNGIVNPNLDASYPVLLGLNGPGGGHAVVCDGYGYNVSTLYHHLNMGWSGNDDAWYALPVVDAYYYYNNIHTCVYNVFTSGSDEIISGRVTDLAGNPIAEVNITAQTSTEGTYQTTTDIAGIYALVNVPSYEDFTVTASKALHDFTEQNVSTGSSSNGASTSGNRWGVDFASQSTAPPTAFSETVSAFSGTTEAITLYAIDDGWPNPPGQLTYIITSLPGHGTLMDPAAGQIKTVPYTLANYDNTVDYWPCPYYTGQDYFDFKANDGGTYPQGGDSEPATITIDVNNVIYTTFAPSSDWVAYWPMGTAYHDSRTQVIYLAGEIGSAKTITDLALDVYQTPGQALNNWTIRMKHTSLSVYSGYPLFETAGWTTVFQGNEPATPGGWRNFHFQNTFEYNGTDNLMIDFSHNNSSSSSDGYCQISDTGATRVLMAFANSTHGDPLSWTSYDIGIYTDSYVPNIKLVSILPAEPISGDFEPDCDVDFYDFACLGQSWLSSTGQTNYNPVCDISEPIDGVIDELDIAVFAENWLESIGP